MKIGYNWDFKLLLQKSTLCERGAITMSTLDAGGWAVVDGSGFVSCFEPGNAEPNKWALNIPTDSGVHSMTYLQEKRQFCVLTTEPELCFRFYSFSGHRVKSYFMPHSENTVPHSMCCFEERFICISDQKRDCLIFWTFWNGCYGQSEFGSKGKGRGKFHAPSGVACSEQTGHVFVADYGNNRVQKLKICTTTQGTYYLKFQSLIGAKRLKRPRLLACSGRHLFVMQQDDSGAYYLDVFDEDGQHTRSVFVSFEETLRRDDNASHTFRGMNVKQEGRHVSVFVFDQYGVKKYSIASTTSFL